MSYICEEDCLDKPHILAAIDAVVENVDLKKNPEFSKEIKIRRARTPDTFRSDRDILEKMSELIAYSNGAKGNLVNSMITQGTLKEVFKDFDANKVAEMNPEIIEEKQWDSIKVMRQKFKIKSIVGCAKILIQIARDKGSFKNLLDSYGIPLSIKNEGDMDDYWNGFLSLQNELVKLEIPHFKSTTTLLHLLLEMGFDCVKPDLIIMRVAHQIGIVNYTTKKPRERDLVNTVKAIQFYCIERKVKPSEIDLYFLVFGGQTGAMHLVN